MEIRPSAFHIKDNYGLLFEVKPLEDISSDVANNEISNFFSRYRIISAYKDTNAIDKKKEALAKVHEPIGNEKKIRPAKFIPMNTLVWIIKQLPIPFGMSEFITYMNEDKTYEGYTSDDKRHMWKSVHAHLTKHKLIKLTNPGVAKIAYKYQYIGVESDTDNKIHELKEGKVITLG